MKIEVSFFINLFSKISTDLRSPEVQMLKQLYCQKQIMETLTWQTHYVNITEKKETELSPLFHRHILTFKYL